LSPSSWGWAALALAGVLAAALLVRAEVRLSRLELSFLGLLAGLAGWVALSALWSESVPQTVLEVERVLVYVAAAAAILLAGRRASARSIADGVLAASVAVAAVNLVLRATGAADASVPGGRAEPVGYENGLAILLVLGVVLALGKRRAVAVPALAVLLLSLLALDSRGPLLALVVGAAAMLVLRHAPRRPLAFPAVVAVGLSVAIVAGAAIRSDRGRYWRVALEQVDSAPALGTGAGTFARVWLRERRAAIATRDAHNLYLETLGELGPVGLALLASALAIPLAVASAARMPETGGAYAAFVVHAGIDWDWEQAAVTVAGLACACALLVAARASPLELSRPARAAGAFAALAVAAVSLVGLAGSWASARGSDAAAEGRWADAERAAARAKRWAPWSADGWRLLGEARRGQGRIAEARRELLLAIEKDPGDPELWLALARVSNGSVRAEALSEAIERDPLGGPP
jgi:O-antigen ligase